MTLNEAAARLGLDPSTLRHQIANGALRATKRGRDWWVTEAAVREYERKSLGNIFGRKK